MLKQDIQRHIYEGFMALIQDANDKCAMPKCLSESYYDKTGTDSLDYLLSVCRLCLLGLCDAPLVFFALYVLRKKSKNHRAKSRYQKHLPSNLAPTVLTPWLYAGAFLYSIMMAILKNAVIF